MMGDKDMKRVIGKLFRPMDTVYTVKADEGAEQHLLKNWPALLEIRLKL